MDKNKRKSTKLISKSADKKPKPKPKTEVKISPQERDFQRLEEYLTESGLSLAFNIIFAELISKQILRENYFTYTAMRLTQIGKEIEGLKTKEIIYVEDKEEEQKNEDNLEEKAEQTDLQPPQIEEKENLLITEPPQKPKEKEKEKPKEKEKEKEKKSEVKSQTKKKKK